MIIVEGLDGVGKTTLVTQLKNFYKLNDVNFKYKSSDGFAKKYFSINLDTVEKGVSDRSFISEIAKGDLVRGICRLSDEDYKKLLSYYASFNTVVVYLKADKDILLERRKNDKDDFEMITNLYEDINAKYDEAIEVAKKYLPVYEFSTNSTSVSEIISSLQNSKVL